MATVTNIDVNKRFRQFIFLLVITAAGMVISSTFFGQVYQKGNGRTGSKSQLPSVHASMK